MVRLWVNQMATTEDTRGRIIFAALKRYLLYGIKKTSMEDVAVEAGLTRVTIYRYFPDKKNLVLASFMRFVEVLQQIHGEMLESPDMDMERVLDRFGEAFSALPRGDLRLAQHELSRLYPDVWRSYLQTRTEALDKIFDPILAKADRRGLLRPGIHRSAMQVTLLNAFIDTLQEPAALNLKASQEEVHHTLKTIFLNGVLRDRR
jgi:AcrR family transcriptional regulator